MKIFVISLKRSQDRREAIKKQLDRQLVKFEFFDAIDGRFEPPHSLFANYNYTKRLWLTSGRMPSKGELGCYASHFLIWKKCIELDESVLVLEDDSEIKDNFSKMLPLIEEKLNRYNFLRLEAETDKGELYQVESDGVIDISFMTDNFGGARSYALSPESAKKLVKHSDRWCMPVDNYIGSIYLHDVPCYIFKPSIVENPQEFLTTIQLGEEKKAPLYRKPSREIYSMYRKFMMSKFNKKYIPNK